MREFFNHDLLVLLSIVFVWGSGSVILYYIGIENAMNVDHWSHDEFFPMYVMAWPLLFALTPLILLIYVVFWPAKKLGQLIGRML